MGAFYFLVVASLLIAAIFGGLYAWAIRSGQWDDLSTPAHRLLTEELDEQRNK